jgi:hypothetical protein
VTHDCDVRYHQVPASARPHSAYLRCSAGDLVGRVDTDNEDTTRALAELLTAAHLARCTQPQRSITPQC